MRDDHSLAVHSRVTSGLDPPLQHRSHRRSDRRVYIYAAVKLSVSVNRVRSPSKQRGNHTGYGPNRPGRRPWVADSAASPSSGSETVTPPILVQDCELACGVRSGSDPAPHGSHLFSSPLCHMLTPNTKTHLQKWYSRVLLGDMHHSD
jgi:hypothetical protein